MWGRGRETSLTPRLLAHFGLTDATELIHRVYHEGLVPSAIGALALYVQQAREGGDLVATFGIDDIELAAGRTTAGAAARGTPRDRGFLA